MRFDGETDEEFGLRSPIPEGFALAPKLGRTVNPKNGKLYEQYVSADAAFFVDLDPTGTVALREQYHGPEEGRARVGGGPYEVTRRSDGSLEQATFYYGAKYHRLGAPAELFTAHPGAPTSAQWYVVGLPCSTEQSYRSVMGTVLRRFPEDLMTKMVRCSMYGQLIPEGMPGSPVLRAITEGVDTVEEMRDFLAEILDAVADGAPVEWVSAFAAGKTS